MAEKKKCFVVQPMHGRAENVYDLYIVPALGSEFEIMLPGEPSRSITTDIFNHLERDALVVANLGAPTRVPAEGNHWLWNPNVMLEAGYRMGLHKPIIFIREKRALEDEPILPFDLFNHTVVELLSSDEEGVRANRLRKISEVYLAAKASPGETGPDEENVDRYVSPAATMSFGARGGIITKASVDAPAFWGYPPGTDPVGLTVNDMVEKLVGKMAPSQRTAFLAEQNQLIGALFQGSFPIATVCIVFGNDPIRVGSKFGQAYLPIGTRFYTAGGNPTTLEVIYLDVTEIAVIGDDAVVRCFLSSRTQTRSASVGN